MEYVSLARQDNHYFIEKWNSSQMEMLGSFLQSDAGSRIYNWIDWLKNTRYKDTSSNFSFLEKEGNNIVIGCQFSEDPYEWTFESSIDDLVYILEEWQKLCSAKKREIIITRENGTFTLEGRD